MKPSYIISFSLLTLINASSLHAMKKDTSLQKLKWGDQMELVAPLDISQKQSLSWVDIAQGVKPQNVAQEQPVANSAEKAQGTLNGSRKNFRPNQTVVWRPSQSAAIPAQPPAQPHEVAPTPNGRKPIKISAVTTSSFYPADRIIEQSHASQKVELYNPQLVAKMRDAQEKEEGNNHDASNRINMHYMQRIVTQLREHAQAMQVKQDVLVQAIKDTSIKHKLLQQEHTKLLKLIVAQNALQMQTLDALATRFAIIIPNSPETTEKTIDSETI